MTDPQDPNQSGSVPEEEPVDSVPVEEEEAIEPEHPRRAASAQFVVSAEIGSAVALREAMDPAQKSLTDALRLSYRMLQLVMAVLIVLFLISGFRNIESSQTGVQLEFGEIQGEGADAALASGFAMGWPYPVGQFLVFNHTDTVELDREFSPFVPPNQTQETAINVARVSDPLRPGRDGSLLTTDGIAHLKLHATYSIDYPYDYVSQLRPEDTKQIVRLALQRGAIHTAARMTVDEFVGNATEVARNVKTSAQELLDSIDSGIELQEERVVATDVKPPYAIVGTFSLLQDALSAAGQRTSEGVQELDKQLVATAGGEYRALLVLIGEYERAVTNAKADPSKKPEVDAALLRIDEFMRSDRIGGIVARAISAAQAHKTDIASTFGNDARRYLALRDEYRRSPKVVVQKHWLDALSVVIGQDDVEIFQVPEGSRHFINVTSLSDVMLQRRKSRRARREQEARDATGLGQFRESFQDEETFGRRQLRVGESGNVTGRRGGG